MMELPPLPLYVYGRECGPNEKVIPLEQVESYAAAAVATAIAEEREACAGLARWMATCCAMGGQTDAPKLMQALEEAIRARKAPRTDHPAPPA